MRSVERLADCRRAPAPCGGDVAGSWRLIENCFDIERHRQSYAQRCLQLIDREVLYSGAILIRPDLSVASSIAVRMNDRLALTASCPRGVCALEGAEWTFTCNAQPSGTCVCDAVTVGTFEDYLPLKLEQQLRAGEYCVRDNLLLLADPENGDGSAITFQREPAAPVPSQPSLLGAEAELTGHCCSDASDANLTTARQVARVGPQVEFPATADIGSQGRVKVDSAVDVESSAVRILMLEDNTAAAAAFNGYRLSFRPGHFNRIRSAAATHSFPTMVTFSDRQIAINVAGATVRRGDQIRVELTLE